jgi:hypothetical protein
MSISRYIVVAVGEHAGGGAAGEVLLGLCRERATRSQALSGAAAIFTTTETATLFMCKPSETTR